MTNSIPIKINMKRLLLLEIGIWVLATTSALAEFDSRVFQSIRRINVPPGKERLLGVNLDHKAISRVQNFRKDLRLVATSESGEQVDVPFLIRDIPVTKPVSTLIPLESRMISFDKDGENNLHLVGELIGKRPNASGLLIESPLKDFEKQVDVSVSDDGKTWTPLVKNELIFDYTQFADFRKTRVALPKNQGVFFKVTIKSCLESAASPFLEISRSSGQSEGDLTEVHKSIRSRPFRIDKISFDQTIMEEKIDGFKTTEYPVSNFTVTPEKDPTRTLIEWVSNGAPVSEIELRTSQRNFRRTVSIEGKPRPDTEWMHLKRCDIYHYQLDTFIKSNLTIPISESQMSRYRITVAEDPASPVAFDRVVTRGPVYQMVWIGDNSKSYDVYFRAGKSAEHPVNRDISALYALLNERFEVASTDWAPEFSLNPNFQADLVSGDSMVNRTAFLWGVIGLAVGILILILFVTARKIEDLN